MLVKHSWHNIKSVEVKSILTQVKKNQMNCLNKVLGTGWSAEAVHLLSGTGFRNKAMFVLLEMYIVSLCSVLKYVSGC